MKKMIYLVLIGMISLYLAGCEKLPVEPENELQLDKSTKELAAFGWNTNHIVSSSAQIQNITSISRYLENDGAGKLPEINSLKMQATALFSESQVHCRDRSALMKFGGDSLLFFEDDSVKGIRKALFYDSDNGIARYYEVKYKFAAWRNIIYDSTEVRVDMNFTLENPGDDLLLGLYQVQRFKPEFFIQSISARLKALEIQGNELTGVEVIKDTHYRSDRYLTRLTQLVRLNPDKSGTLREDFEFGDGKTAHSSVTFYPDDTGIFEEQKRDGTVVTGRFDSFEDDGKGYYEEVTDYPEGRIIDKIEKFAQLSLTLPDSILTVKYAETRRYSSGQAQTDSASIRVDEQPDVKYTTLKYYKYNGEHGTLNIEERASESTLVGEWTTHDNYFILVNATYYIDGSGQIHYEVYTSETDYLGGSEPIFVADYTFSPDGSGSGALSHKGESYELTFNESGSGEIKSGDKSTTVNLFE
ncbi:hypothetical protein JXJ21_11975 [candidate division KSB1 bacterium]|nr:hypothetical protein [candidate division KSB1 bacterium]